MAYENNLRQLSIVATGDLTGKRHRFITAAGALCAAGAKMIGVCQLGVALGQTEAYGFEGVTKIVLGGTVALDGLIASDANGAGVPAATGNYVGGRALAAGVAGDLIPMMLKGATISP